MTYPGEQQPDAGHDFFGPGTDLAISLVAALVLVIAAQIAAHGLELERTVELVSQQDVEQKVDLALLVEGQELVMNRLASELESQLEDLGQQVYRIRIDPRACPGTAERPTNDGSCAITVEHQLATQRILLGESVLFAEDRYEVDARSREVLTAISRVLKNHLDSVQEIRIEGHADTQRSNRFDSNLELAAMRAMAVYKVLVAAELDPIDAVVSVASLGEFVPVQRSYEAMGYSAEELRLANDSEEELRLNRRVEISLLYRWPLPVGKGNGQPKLQ